MDPMGNEGNKRQEKEERMQKLLRAAKIFINTVYWLVPWFTLIKFAMPSIRKFLSSAALAVSQGPCQGGGRGRNEASPSGRIWWDGAQPCEHAPSASAVHSSVARVPVNQLRRRQIRARFARTHREHLPRSRNA